MMMRQRLRQPWIDNPIRHQMPSATGLLSITPRSNHRVKHDVMYMLTHEFD